MTQMRTPIPTRTRSSQAGLSLIELMISITIGLLLLAGLATLFSNSSNSQKEMRRGAQQIENGRYAMDVLQQDLQLAGYLGHFRNLAAPAALPDPCLLTTANLTTLANLPVLGYSAPSLTTTPGVPANCLALLPTANLQPGSDVLVIVRADTNVVPIGTTTTAGTMYVQTNPVTLDVQNGGGTTSCTSKADGTGGSITRRCTTPPAGDICSAICPAGSPVGYIRQLHVDIYFVAPCSVPSGGTTCAATDDGGQPIPTLKRLELTSSGGAATFQTIALAEGVEFMKLGWGIDDTPSVGCSGTPCINTAHNGATTGSFIAQGCANFLLSLPLLNELNE